MTTMPGLCRTMVTTLALACFFLGGVGAYSKCCQACLNSYPMSTCVTRNIQSWLRNPAWTIIDPTWIYIDLNSVYGGDFQTNVCSDCPAGFYRHNSNTGSWADCNCAICSYHYTDPKTGIEYINNESPKCIYDNNMVDLKKCTTDTNKECKSCSYCEAGMQCTGYGKDKTCTACPAGTYRNEILNEQKTTCLACTVCNLANRERKTPCGPVYDSTCVQCGAGNIVTQSVAGGDYDTCTACNSGSYPDTFARAADNKCAGCITCPQTQKQTSPCQATADRVCANCIDHQRSKGLNGACDGCDGGYVRGVSGCIPCEQAGCGNNQYIKCVTSADNMGSRDCLFCQGHNHASSLQCNPGYGVSTFCTGNSTAVVTCALCAVGTERPAGTALVPNGDSTVSIQKCVPCATGKYKTGVGAGDCQACGNKPVNSVYAPWSTTVAGTAVCPW